MPKKDTSITPLSESFDPVAVQAGATVDGTKVQDRSKAPASTDDRPPDSLLTTILNGQIQLAQPVRGYRAGLDAALLAASLPEFKRPARILETGCGAGAALLAATWRNLCHQFVGIERDAFALSLARYNIAQNGLDTRCQALAGDIELGFSKHGLDRFDLVMANPPYFDDPEPLKTLTPEKTGAWIADGGLKSWTRFWLKSVKDEGHILVIHRADRLSDLLILLSQKAGSFQIRPIQPYADQPAKRVLILARKCGKAPLVLHPPLILHDRQSLEKHTPEAEAILRGTARLSWA